MNCIFDDYIKFVENFLSNYFRLLLENKYERRLVRPLIDKYISVRYYNDSVILDNKFTVRLNKELNNVAKEIINESKDKTEKVKNIFALFSYILFIEKCNSFTELNSIIKSLFSDKTITLTYSEYAIERAYDSEVVVENKVYLMLLLLSSRVLKDSMELKYDNNYVIDFPVSLFDKQKKILKYIKAIDNDYLKTKIHLKIKYQDYKKYKKQINNLINQGFSISLELDETYDMDFSCLLLFTYIFLDKKYRYYDIIMNSRDDVKTTMITLRGE